MREIIRDRRAVSPVIATVILVAVAITVAVAVAYWMGGIAGQYTKFEQIEIQSAVCTYDSTDEDWTIELTLKNTGTASVTLLNAFINEIEIQNYGVETVGEFRLLPANPTATSLTGSDNIKSGDTLPVYIWIDKGYETLSSGTAVNIKIHSAGGMDYSKLIELA